MTGSYTRATDSDRNDICQMLDAALGEGQLSNEEHRQRVIAATDAATIGELQSLVSDLQIHSAPGRPPGSKASSGRLGMGLAVAAAAVVAVLVLSGGLLAWALWPNSSSPPKSTPATSTKPSPAATATATALAPTTTVAPTTTAAQEPPNLLTLGGLTGLFAQIRTKFGDTMGYQLLVYSDKATISRPDAANAHKIVSFVYYKNGWLDWISTSSSSPPPDMINRGDTAVGDLSKFDMQAILGAVREAPTTVNVNNPTDTYMFIDSAKDGSLGFEIHVATDAGSGGYMDVAADGTVKKVYAAS